MPRCSIRKETKTPSGPHTWLVSAHGLGSELGQLEKLVFFPERTQELGSQRGVVLAVRDVEEKQTQLCLDRKTN